MHRRPHLHRHRHRRPPRRTTSLRTATRSRSCACCASASSRASTSCASTTSSRRCTRHISARPPTPRTCADVALALPLPVSSLALPRPRPLVPPRRRTSPAPTPSPPAPLAKPPRSRSTPPPPRRPSPSTSTAPPLGATCTARPTMAPPVVRAPRSASSTGPSRRRRRLPRPTRTALRRATPGARCSRRWCVRLSRSPTAPPRSSPSKSSARAGMDRWSRARRDGRRAGRTGPGGAVSAGRRSRLDQGCVPTPSLDLSRAVEGHADVPARVLAGVAVGEEVPTSHAERMRLKALERFEK